MRVIRIRFGVDDLARLTFAPPSRFCELGVSIQVLRHPASPYRQFGQGRAGGLPRQVGKLLELVPAHGSVPDFLSPQDSCCLDDAIEIVLATPTPRIRTEMAAAALPSSVWLRDLANGCAAARSELGRALRAYHSHVAVPLWPTLQRAASADLAHRARQLAGDGAAAVLNGLHPRIRWFDGVLNVDVPVTADIDLAGRGLRLTPTILTRPAFPLAWSQPTLCYPLPASRWQSPSTRPSSADALSEILGTTRARVLRALATEYSTSGLARTLGISLAAASTHTTALRHAGLVNSCRDGRAMRHSRTTLGEQIATTADSATILARSPWQSS